MPDGFENRPQTAFRRFRAAVGRRLSFLKPDRQDDLALHAERARSSRRKKFPKSYRRNLVQSLQLALRGEVTDEAAGGRSGSPIVRYEPIMHSRGGFFCAMVATKAARRYFVKAISSDSREAYFWQAWRNGQISRGGRYYDIAPPTQIFRRKGVTILVFPEDLELTSSASSKKAQFRGNLELAIRAIADFNSDHVKYSRRYLFPSGGCDALPAPDPPSIEQALGVAPERAKDHASAVEAIETRWPQVKDRLYAKPSCLCHMDFGPNNFGLTGSKGVIRDFGLAGIAPLGSDLHTVFRYGRRLGSGWPDKRRLVEIYAGVFEEKSLTVEAEMIHLAMDAHFSARYRNLNLESARAPRAFETAVEIGSRLTASA